MRKNMTFSALLVLGATMLSMASGCAIKPSLPAAQLPGSGLRPTQFVPIGGVRRSVESMRQVLGVGQGTHNEWLEIRDGGAIRIDGYLSGSAYDLGESRFLVTVIVPGSAGDLVRFRAVPAVIDEHTAVTWRGRDVKFSDLLSSPFDEPGGRFLRAEFHLTNEQTIFVDRLDYGERLVESRTPDDYPPGIDLRSGDLLKRSTRTAEVAPLLDFTSGGKRAVIEGYLGQSAVSDDADAYGYGFVDVVCPDSLGDATVFQIIRVFMTTKRDALMMQDRVGSTDDGWVSMDVELRDSTLWLAQP